MFQVYLPELFDDKKSPDDESDYEVIDVHRHGHACLEIGVYEDSGREKAETQLRGGQGVLQSNKSDLVSNIAVELGERILCSKNSVEGMEAKIILDYGEIGINFKTTVLYHSS